MEAVQIKEILHEYIDTVDEKKLEAIYTVLKDSLPNGYEFNEEMLVFCTLEDSREHYPLGPKGSSGFLFSLMCLWHTGVHSL